MTESTLTGNDIEETAVPCPYREIVGRRHCRLLILTDFDATGNDMRWCHD